MLQYIIILLLLVIVSGYNNRIRYNAKIPSKIKSRSILLSSSSSSTTTPPSIPPPPSSSSSTTITTNKLQKAIAIISLSLSLSNSISIDNSFAASGAGTVSALEESISRLETSESRGDVLQSMAGNSNLYIITIYNNYTITI